MTAPIGRGRRRVGGRVPAVEPRGARDPTRSSPRTPASLADYGLDKPQLAPSTVVVEGAKDPLELLLGDKIAGRQRRLRQAAGQSRGSSPSPPTSRARSTRSPSTCATATCSTSSATTCKTLEISGPGGRLRARPERQGRVGLHEAARHPGRPLVRGRPAGHRREPAHGVGRRRGREGPEALRPRQARADGGARASRDGSAQDPRDRRRPAAGQEVRTSADGGRGRLVAVDPGRARGRPRQGDGGAAGQAPARSRDLRGGGLRRRARARSRRPTRRRTTKDKDGARQSQWKRTAPDAKDLETNKVEDALFKIGGVEVAEFVDAAEGRPRAYGLDAPAFKLVAAHGRGQGRSLRSSSARRTARSTRAAAATRPCSSSTRPRPTS